MFRKKKTVIKSHSMYQFRVNFITLTLAGVQKHTDQYIKNELLNDFLEWLRTKHAVKSYIWKAEPQKNGNIHFHITSNVDINHTESREKWNRIQQKHGYLDEYHDKFKDLTLTQYVSLLRSEGNCKDFKDLKRSYEIGCADNWMNPNSTDVHSTKKVRKMAGYMAKYMTKSAYDPRTYGQKAYTRNKNQQIEILQFWAREINVDNLDFVWYSGEYSTRYLGRGALFLYQSKNT